jgi:hypothetical protein
MSALDALLATTFAHPDAARAALDAAGRDPATARKALARKKTTPLSPATGARLLRLIELARARGPRATPDRGPLRFLEFGLPPDLAALEFASMYWDVGGVDLGGARLHGAGITTSEKRLAGGSVMPLLVGTLSSGEALVFRYASEERSTWVAVAPDGTERAFSGLEAILAEIEAEAASRGLPNPFQAPPAEGARPPGPPVAAPGDDHRVYAGAELLEAELPDANLYVEQRQVLLRFPRKTKFSDDDLWLVSREGQLFKLTPVGKVQRGSVLCRATPHP